MRSAAGDWPGEPIRAEKNHFQREWRLPQVTFVLVRHHAQLPRAASETGRGAFDTPFRNVRRSCQNPSRQVNVERGRSHLAVLRRARPLIVQLTRLARSARYAGKLPDKLFTATPASWQLGW
jgi:hypothetical protein